MIPIVALFAVVAGCCLVFLSVVTPLLAIDWWMHYVEHHTIILSVGLTNAVGMTLTAAAIWYLNYRLVRWVPGFWREMREALRDSEAGKQSRDEGDGARDVES